MIITSSLKVIHNLSFHYIAVRLVGRVCSHLDNSWPTVIQFKFQSDTEGEIHGIGFETDGELSPELIFQLHGSQEWGIQDYNELYTAGSGAQSYEIAIGQYYTGDYDRIVFVMDDDAGGSTVGADSTFSDLVML